MKSARAPSQPTSRPTAPRAKRPLRFLGERLDEAPPASVHLGWGRKLHHKHPHAFGLRHSLAQPPEINETFVREVEENLRRDQLRDFAKKYGGFIIVLVVL